MRNRPVRLGLSRFSYGLMPLINSAMQRLRLFVELLKVSVALCCSPPRPIVQPQLRLTQTQRGRRNAMDARTIHDRSGPWRSPELVAIPASPAIVTGPEAHSVTYRPALFADSRQIARLLCVAGDGLYEFLFDDLIPFVTAAEFLAIATATQSYSISFRNWFVAIDGTVDAIIGAINVCPADLLKQHLSLIHI